MTLNVQLVCEKCRTTILLDDAPEDAVQAVRRRAYDDGWVRILERDDYCNSCAHDRGYLPGP